MFRIYVLINNPLACWKIAPNFYSKITLQFHSFWPWTWPSSSMSPNIKHFYNHKKQPKSSANNLKSQRYHNFIYGETFWKFSFSYNFSSKFSLNLFRKFSPNFPRNSPQSFPQNFPKTIPQKKFLKKFPEKIPQKKFP